jgi:hypothetical protein
VQPPQGVPIVLTEDPHSQPNWIAAAGPMESALTHKLGEKVIEFRKSNPLIDWSGVNYPGDSDARRVVKFVSAATD